MNQIDEKYWNLISKSLSNNLTSEEEAELKTWLAMNPSHEQLLQELKLSWNAVDQYGTQFSPNKELAWMKLSELLGFAGQEEQTAVKKMFPWYRAAAAVFILLLGSWFLWRALQSENWVQIASAYTITEVILPDSSKVWLSKNSNLRYHADMKVDAERKVVLEGEAFFEVTHNPSKPFIVQAFETETKVLGTSFNVLARKSDPDVQVSVLTGRVQFQNSSAVQNKLILEPGTQGVYTKATAALSKKQTAGQNFLFWKNRRLDFTNVKVSDALQELEKSYGVHFILKDTAIGSKRITTSFEDESIDQINAELSVLLDVEITKSDTTYLVRTIK